MPFRFIHTADIHIDSPLRSLSMRNAELADLIGDATRQALVSIVDLALEEQVDALVIAGDLYDGDQTSMKTARFLAAEMQRLHQAGIAVYIIRGNHDALSRITQELTLPPSVKLFGGRAEAVEIERSGLPVVIHGLSFARPQAPDSLLPKYRPPVAGAVNIGLMHTSLAGAPGHDLYAPCAVADLHAAGFDYWALGHIHQRTDHPGGSRVIMPGMPQGRDINEAGAKTVSLVTIGDDRSILIEERLTSIAQFERVSVDVAGIHDWRAVVETIDDAMRTARSKTRSRDLVLRIRLSGATPLAWRLRRDADVLQAEAEHRAAEIGRTWIEKIEFGALGTEQAEQTGAMPILELETLMRGTILKQTGFRDEMRQMVRDFLDDLPPEIRRFAGQDEEGFESYLDKIGAEGVDEITARMAAGDREDS